MVVPKKRKHEVDPSRLPEGLDHRGGRLFTLRLRPNGRHFRDDILMSIFFNENLWILKKISLKYVPYGLIGNIASLVQIFEAMLVCCTDIYICVTGPQLVNSLWPSDAICQQRSWWTLAQVMACCLTASNQHLNQCWLIISLKVHLHSSEGNLTMVTISDYYYFKDS